jgi:hypothetical protein
VKNVKKILGIIAKWSKILILKLLQGSNKNKIDKKLLISLHQLYYSLMEKKPDATMQEIEDVLDGNLCRCTGYRPIFDAFKSMASDASADLISKVRIFLFIASV